MTICFKAAAFVCVAVLCGLAQDTNAQDTSAPNSDYIQLGQELKKTQADLAESKREIEELRRSLQELRRQIEAQSPKPCQSPRPQAQNQPLLSLTRTSVS
jgi:septal ring factor EnvC (AmiA/AmiB activator)